MNRFKRVVRIIVNVLTCILFVLLGLVIYGKAVLVFSDSKYPNYFGYTFFEVASGSMEPTLHVNDVVLVKITKENLKEKDIIAYDGEDAIITHRILLIEGNILLVKGDNNQDVVDKPITIDQVIGKVVKVYPELGIWKKVLTEPKILFGIFITLLLFDFALSYGEKDKSLIKLKKKEEKKETKEEKTEDLVKEVLPEPEPVVKEEKKEEKKPEKVIEKESLLELTRKINIDEINSLLEGTEYKLEKKEINNIKKEISKVEQQKDDKVEMEPMFSENERKALEYTLRLDLNEIQKKIKSKVK